MEGIGFSQNGNLEGNGMEIFLELHILSRDMPCDQKIKTNEIRKMVVNFLCNDK